MQLVEYIKNPALLNRETLYELRSYVALNPCNQVARLLLLQNLYLLHDSSFDEELRQAAFFITDRTVLFNLVEAKHAKITKKERRVVVADEDRTNTLISNFLETVAEEAPKPADPGRKPTAADATVDYVAYLLQTMQEEEEKPTETDGTMDSLIDSFLENEGKITISDAPDSSYTPHKDVVLENDKDALEEDYFTETLAKIYIKQGRYTEALEIIQHLHTETPDKSAYYSDQMRFLEKIIYIKQK